ncbi:MAG: hypothetical protein SOT02_00495 [Elusimicrobiaceae bacterium]|uniref:hypothetical protein n=1 Tax=Candidatus Avelusimicrobium faecicola TaxID=3416205 RepID=UPI002A798784|nr:hypothetical protein [Spirochaetota bacterium]MDY2939426.1 hypothetical protein [Elusimicrobiaceae bacterium]
MPKKQMDPLEQLTTALDGEMKRLLAAPYGSPCVQLQLFSDFCEVKAARKGKNKWNFEDELLAQLLARGYSRLEAYKLSHKDSKTANLNTLYPNASRACNRSNVLARVEEIKRELQARALMSTTEYFSILNDIARKPSKNWDRTAALKMIGQIKGVFQAEKGLPGSAGEPLVLAWATAPEPATGTTGAARRIESQSSCSEFPNSCRGNDGTRTEEGQNHFGKTNDMVSGDGTRTEEKRGAYSGGVADGRKQDKAASSFSVSLGSLADQKEGGRHA